MRASLPLSPSLLHSPLPPPSYALTIWEETSLFLSACPNGGASSGPTVALYESKPSGTPLAAAAPGLNACAGVGAHLYRRGTYYVAVDSATPASGGAFSLSLGCQSLAGPALGDNCGYEFLSCGDDVDGTTRGYPDVAGSAAGDAVYLYTVFEPTSAAFSTCDAEETDFRAVVMIFDGPPHEGGRRLAPRLASGEDAECTTVFLELPLAQTYYVVVTSDSDAEGVFRLSVTCAALPSPPHVEACSYAFLGCSTATRGSTIGYLDTAGNASPDVTYMFTAFEPADVVLSACVPDDAAATMLDARIRVYDGAPTKATSSQLASSGTGCALSLTLEHAGSYYILVEGAHASPDDVGLFEIALACRALDLPALGEHCSYSFLGCGSSTLGTNVGFPDYVGHSAGDAVYVVSVWDPMHIVLTTCSVQTTFRAAIAIYDRVPTRPGAEIVATSDDVRSRTTGCGSLFTDLVPVGTYYVVVTGADAGAEGIFELTLACDRVEIPDAAEPCTYAFLGCHEPTLGTTVDAPDLVGRRAGETVYAVTAFEPTVLTWSTCSDNTRLATTLALFDGVPGAPRTRLMDRSVDARACSSLTSEIWEPGTYVERRCRCSSYCASYCAYYCAHGLRPTATSLPAPPLPHYSNAQPTPNS